MCVCVCVHVCACSQRPEEGVTCPPLPLFACPFEAGSLIEAGVMFPVIYLSLPQSWDNIGYKMPDWLCGCWDLNSGLYGCVTSSLNHPAISPAPRSIGIFRREPLSFLGNSIWREAKGQEQRTKAPRHKQLGWTWPSCACVVCWHAFPNTECSLTQTPMLCGVPITHNIPHPHPHPHPLDLIRKL